MPHCFKQAVLYLSLLMAFSGCDKATALLSGAPNATNGFRPGDPHSERQAGPAPSVDVEEPLAVEGCDSLLTPKPDPSGRKIYISTQGNDNNNSCDNAGSNHPFASLEAAAGCARAGDTLYLLGGTYVGGHSLQNLTGTADHWILITNSPGEKVILDGGEGLKNFESIVTLAHASYVALSGLEIRNTGVVASPYGGATCVNVNNGNHVVVSNSEIHHCARQALLWTGSTSNVLADGNKMHDSVLLNKDSQSFKTLGYWDGTTATSGNANDVHQCVSWRRNEVRSSWGECIDAIRVNRGAMVANTVSDCYSAHLYLDSSARYRLDGNYLYDTSDAYGRADVGRATGIAMAKEYTDGHAQQTMGIVITNNIIDSVGEGIRWGNWSSQDGTYGNVTVANNTVVNTRDNAIHFDAPSNQAPAGANVLFNNIVYKNAGVGQALLIGNLDSWKVEANEWPNGIPSGVDASNVAVDPRLSNATVGQSQSYKLSAGSPAIAAGRGDLASAPVADFWGVARSTKTPSVGADEHASAPTVVSSLSP